MMSLRHIPPSQYNIILKEKVIFHVINDDYPRGLNFQAPAPKDISFAPHKITKPPFPGVTQHSLQNIKRAIFFADFSCDKHCRSLGICVHYQFVLGSKRCPDGLICESCKAPDVDQVAIKASRACPLHYRPQQLKPIGSRPEDFIATNAQFQVAGEILHRSVESEWADLDRNLLQRYDNATGSTRQPAYAPTITPSPVTYLKREQTPKTIEDILQSDQHIVVDPGPPSAQSDSSEEGNGFRGAALQNSLLNQGHEPDKVTLSELEAEMKNEQLLMWNEWQGRQPAYAQEMNRGLG